MYEIPDHPELVVKISSGWMAYVLFENFKQGKPLDSLEVTEQKTLGDEIQKKTQRLSRLAKYFGRSHVLPERLYAAKIPVTPSIIRDACEGKPPKGAEQLYEAWSIVVIQKKSEGLQNKDHLCLHVPYIEDTKNSREGKKVDINPGYQEITEQLVQFKNTAKPFDLKKFNAVYHDNFAQIILLCEKDPEFKKMFGELITKMIKFSTETGEILDIAGKDNIIFFNKNGGVGV